MSAQPSAVAADRGALPRIPEAMRVPDFIIAGAMKCGTTSLHHILGAHPGVFIPAPEIHFYDADEILQHADFFRFDAARWSHPRFDEALVRWYGSFFEAAAAHQLVGEDSTTYFSSEHAAARIAALAPDTRIVVMLRDPASRAFSHYWHLVRTGRATLSFEEHLQREPFGVISRSYYRRNLENWLRSIPRERIKVVVFEEFIRDTPAVVAEVAEHIGLDAGGVFWGETEAHRNRGVVPRFASLQLLRNRLLRAHAGDRYRSHLPGQEPPAGKRFFTLIDGIHRRVNRLTFKRRPRMLPETRAFLDDLFARENRGLNELIGRDVEKYWYGSS